MPLSRKSHSPRTSSIVKSFTVEDFPLPGKKPPQFIIRFCGRHVQISTKKGDTAVLSGNKSARRFCEYFPVVRSTGGEERLLARRRRTKRVGASAKHGLIAGALTCVRLALDATAPFVFLATGAGFVELPRRPQARKVRAAVFRNLAEACVPGTVLGKRQREREGGREGGRESRVYFSYNEKRWPQASWARW